MVKAGGRTYVYVTEYTGNIEYSSRKETRIFNLGNSENALRNLKMWSKNNNLIPPVINRKDHSKINEWIKKVNLKVSV